MPAPKKWMCQKCGRTTRNVNKPLKQGTGKCPKDANGNHSWIKAE